MPSPPALLPPPPSEKFKFICKFLKQFHNSINGTITTLHTHTLTQHVLPFFCVAPFARVLADFTIVFAWLPRLMVDNTTTNKWLLGVFFFARCPSPLSRLFSFFSVSLSPSLSSHFCSTFDNQFGVNNLNCIFIWFWVSHVRTWILRLPTPHTCSCINFCMKWMNEWMIWCRSVSLLPCHLCIFGAPNLNMRIRCGTTKCFLYLNGPRPLIFTCAQITLPIYNWAALSNMHWNPRYEKMNENRRHLENDMSGAMGGGGTTVASEISWECFVNCTKLI